MPLLLDNEDVAHTFVSSTVLTTVVTVANYTIADHDVQVTDLLGRSSATKTLAIRFPRSVPADLRGGSSEATGREDFGHEG